MKNALNSLAIIALLVLIPSATYAQEKPITDPWSSSLSVSFFSVTGNAETETLMVDAEATCKTSEDELSLKLGGIHGKTAGVLTSEYNFLSAKYDRNITPSLYAFFLAGLESNRFAGYDLRTKIYPGLGYQFVETEKHSLKGEVSPGYIHEDRIGDQKTVTFFSSRTYAKYQYDYSAEAAFSQDVEYLKNHDDEDDYQVNAETALTMKLSDTLSLKKSYLVQYVEEPPPGMERRDTTVSVALVLDF